MPIEQFIDYIYLSEVNFDSNLDYKLRLSGVTQLYFFQLIGYYIIVMAIFSSIIGVFDINSGGSAILATINCMSAAKSTIFQAFFCFLVLFFWDSGMLNNFLFKTAFFTLDSYVILICSILCLSVILILMLSSSYVLQTKKDSLEMPTFFSFSLAFMIFFVSSSNLVSAFVSLEGLSFILYVLAALNFTSHASIEAAVKYFCLGGLSSGILLFGITLIYGLMGSTNFFCIRSCLISWSKDSEHIFQNYLFTIFFSIFLIFFGFFFKMSAFPCHTWTPDVYEGSPLIVTAFFGIVVKFVIFSFFIRLVSFVFFTIPFITTPILIFSALGSLIIGAFGALKQKKIKRFVAYTSINQVGFLLAGLSCGSFTGTWATLLHLIIYTVMSFGLFSFLLGVTKFFDQNNIIYMSDLNNFGQKNPNISIMLTILLFSMAGVPPLGGFFGKYFILLAITEYSNFALVVIALFINVISAFYYIRIIKNLWFGSKQTKCNVFFYTKDWVFSLILTVCILFLILTAFLLPYLLDFSIFLAKLAFNPFS